MILDGLPDAAPGCRVFMSSEPSVDPLRANLPVAVIQGALKVSDEVGGGAAQIAPPLGIWALHAIRLVFPPAPGVTQALRLKGVGFSL